MTKKQLNYALIIIGILILGVLIFSYGGSAQVPEMGEDGTFTGNYSLAGIMKLEKPYRCTFEKSDESAKVAGVIHTDGKNFFGEYRIRTDLAEDDFSSFVIGRGRDAYAWTSLQPIGYKSGLAGSASKNASPEEQAQIIGTKDKLNYECEPWQNPDPTMFEVPSWITFVDLNQ